MAAKSSGKGSRKSAAPRRRPKGSGSYWYNKHDKLHCWRIVWNGEKHYTSDKDPERAERAFRDLVRQLEDGVKVTDGRQTLWEYYTRWLELVIQPNVNESTLSNYEHRGGYHILPGLGHYALNALTSEIGQRWLNALQKDGVAHTSITQALSLAKRCLDRAVADRLIPYNPFAVLKAPRKPRVELDDEEDEEGKRSLSVVQQEALLADVKAHDKHWASLYGKEGRKARSEGTYVCYIVALRLGLRRGELLGLRRKDVDIERRVLRVR